MGFMFCIMIEDAGRQCADGKKIKISAVQLPLSFYHYIKENSF